MWVLCSVMGEDNNKVIRGRKKGTQKGRDTGQMLRITTKGKKTNPITMTLCKSKVCCMLNTVSSLISLSWQGYNKLKDILRRKQGWSKGTTSIWGITKLIWVSQSVKRFLTLSERFMRSGASWKGQIGDGCSFFLLKPELRASNEIIKRLVQKEQKGILFH